MSALDRKMAATRVVQKLLGALDDVGERNGLQLSDFVVSTDPRNDYASEGKIFTDRLAESEAIAATSGSTNIIIINAQTPNGFYSQMTNFGDPNRELYVYKGAAIAKHEQYHNNNPKAGENPAWREEQRVFRLFRPKFRDNLQLYEVLDNAITNGIANHG